MSKLPVERPPLAVLILAAGLGTRMKSDVPKVLHEVCGRPMLAYVIDAALALSPERLVVVTGPGEDGITQLLPVGCERAVQQERRGTGDAVRAGIAQLEGFTGDVMVLYGDVPLVHADFVSGLLLRHLETGAAATLTTTRLDDPAHYGRIIRAADGRVARIVEYRDASDEQRAIAEINVGLYVFASAVLRPALGGLRADNAQGELYLTDVVHQFLGEGLTVSTHESDDEELCMGVNSRVELAGVNAAMRRRLLERLMLQGVTVEDPSTTYVDWGVQVGRDTFLRAGTHLLGRTTVGEASEIGPGSFLRDAFVGDHARVVSSHLVDCVIGSRCSVGPFAYIRPNAVLSEGAKAGTFVEIKNSRIGEGSKVPHLSYVGDAVIGRGTNIGAGNITANYDGFEKHPTCIGDNVRTGSDTTMVAPVTIGDGAFTAAGSVITQDVPAGALGVARSRQQTIEGYAARRRARRERERGEKQSD
jgi:bifunctional UDP-N-acetylglucosamine pyrophosphorylase/glucosamine-1-phosphate N-acetyltransferase